MLTCPFSWHFYKGIQKIEIYYVHYENMACGMFIMWKWDIKDPLAPLKGCKLETNWGSILVSLTTLDVAIPVIALTNLVWLISLVAIVPNLSWIFFPLVYTRNEDLHL